MITIKQRIWIQVILLGEFMRDEDEPSQRVLRIYGQGALLGKVKTSNFRGF